MTRLGCKPLTRKWASTAPVSEVGRSNLVDGTGFASEAGTKTLVRPYPGFQRQRPAAGWPTHDGHAPASTLARLAAVLPQSPRTPPSEGSSTDGMTTALGAGKDSSEAGTVPRVVCRDSSPRASLRCPPRLITVTLRERELIDDPDYEPGTRGIDGTARGSLSLAERHVALLNQAAPYAQSFPAWRTGQTGGR